MIRFACSLFALLACCSVALAQTAAAPAAPWLTPDQMNYVYMAVVGILTYSLKHFGIKIPLLHQLLVAIAPNSDTPTAAPAPKSAPAPGSISPAAVATASMMDVLGDTIAGIMAHPTATPAEKANALNQITTAVAPLVTPTPK